MNSPSSQPKIVPARYGHYMKLHYVLVFDDTHSYCDFNVCKLAWSVQNHWNEHLKKFPKEFMYRNVWNVCPKPERAVLLWNPTIGNLKDQYQPADEQRKCDIVAAVHEFTTRLREDLLLLSKESSFKASLDIEWSICSSGQTVFNEKIINNYRVHDGKVVSDETK